MRACTSQVDRERRESFRVNSSAGARRLVFLTGDTSVCAQHAPLTAPHTRRRIELEGFGGQPGHKPRPSCWLRCGNAIVALPRGDQWRGLGHTLAACARRQNPCCRDWRSFGRRSVRAASATQRLGLCLTVPARWPAGMLGPCMAVCARPLPRCVLQRASFVPTPSGGLLDRVADGRSEEKQLAVSA